MTGLLAKFQPRFRKCNVAESYTTHLLVDICLPGHCREHQLPILNCHHCENVPPEARPSLITSKYSMDLMHTWCTSETVLLPVHSDLGISIILDQFRPFLTSFHWFKFLVLVIFFRLVWSYLCSILPFRENKIWKVISLRWTPYSFW